MRQVKKSVNQPILEILLLDIDDDGNVLFEEYAAPVCIINVRANGMKEMTT